MVRSYTNYLYNQSMSRYEQACREANASNQSARAQGRQDIEDSLVEQGVEAIDAYEATLDERWKRANCLAEYDGLRMGYGIAQRARQRVSEQG